MKEVSLKKTNPVAGISQSATSIWNWLMGDI